jgi:hypothetical protein
MDQFFSSPFIQGKKSHIQKIRDVTINPWVDKASRNYYTMQATVYQKYNQLPKFVLRRVDHLKAMYDEAENTELKPILVKCYWKTIDFYQKQIEPAVFQNPYSNQLTAWVDQHEYIQRYRRQSHFQRYMKSCSAQLYDKLHLKQLYYHISSLLPQRLPGPTNSVKEKLEQIIPNPTTRETNTPMLSKIIDSVKAQIQKVTNKHDSPTVSPFERIEQVEEQAILL